MQREPRAGQVAEVRLPSVSELVVTGAKKVAASPKALSFVGIWIFGLFCMLYASAPVTITDEMREDFESKLAESNSVAGFDEALEDLYTVQEQLYHEKTWFWSFNSAKASRVYELQGQAAKAEQRFAKLNQKREELRRDAFNIVGLFSEMGVQEARQLFWDCLEKGKGFARRSTFYDMFFSVVMHRDEEMASFVVRVILNFVINATMGMIGVVLAFIYYLYAMVIAYKASFFSGLAFFLLAGIAGLSMAALYMFVLYGTIVGGTYTLIKTAIENNRIEGGRRGPGGQPMRPIQHRQRRPHYE